jgi:probable HAF family extracellular repeat protein
LAPDSGWTLASANGINDRGQIVGYGIGPLPNGPHAFLLTPAPVRH